MVGNLWQRSGFGGGIWQEGMFTSLGMDEYCKAYRHDLSGGRTIERHAVGRNLIGKEIGVEKLIFGSDCAADEVHEHVERFEAIFE